MLRRGQFVAGHDLLEGGGGPLVGAADQVGGVMLEAVARAGVVGEHLVAAERRHLR